MTDWWMFWLKPTLLCSPGPNLCTVMVFHITTLHSVSASILAAVLSPPSGGGTGRDHWHGPHGVYFCPIWFNSSIKKDGILVNWRPAVYHPGFASAYFQNIPRRGPKTPNAQIGIRTWGWPPNPTSPRPDCNGRRPGTTCGQKSGNNKFHFLFCLPKQSWVIIVSEVLPCMSLFCSQLLVLCPRHARELRGAVWMVLPVPPALQSTPLVTEYNMNPLHSINKAPLLENYIPSWMNNPLLDY